MSQFRQIVPNSLINANNASYEFNLCWLSPAGGVRTWMFSHTDGEEVEQFNGYAIESISDVRSVPSEDRVMIEARTRSLTLENFNYVKSVLKSNRVYVVGKDFSKTPIALQPGSIARPNSLKEFEVRIRFYFKEEFLLNV